MTALRRPLVALAAALALAPRLAAQGPRFDFYARGPYRAEVPRPATLLGYEPGEFHTNYSNMKRVIHATWQAAPERARGMSYGRSEERGPGCAAGSRVLRSRGLWRAAQTRSCLSTRPTTPRATSGSSPGTTPSA